MFKFDKIEDALQDIKNGKLIVVLDNEDRENEGDLICSADFATPENINFMATYAKGLICMPISKQLADKLNLNQMVENNTDNHQTAFTVSIDHINTTTGISAYERSLTVLEAIKNTAKPEDFRRPGHMFPLTAKDGGVLVRNGHTEATVDISLMAGLSPAGLCCEIMSDDGKMMRTAELMEFAKNHNLKIITIEDLIEYKKSKYSSIKNITSANLPTKYGDFKLYGYENYNKEHHIALVMGDIKKNDPTLVRVHSECLTGDVFGSEKCDCGNQLDFALKEIAKEKKGVLIYLRQEGRGIGLINKIKAYSLQEQGLDTVEANLALGFPADMRNFEVAGHILKDLNVNKVRLMTNNPDKINNLKSLDIEIVERVPLEVEHSGLCSNYMKTKKSKMGHILEKY